MTDLELSYVTPEDPAWRRVLMRAIETVSGRGRLLPIYHRWRDEVVGRDPHMMQAALRMVGTRLEIEAAEGWCKLPETPLVIVANHPFGIADGIALLAIAEAIGRPYRSLSNADFMRVPEMRRIALPIDFNPTKQATRTNLETRAAARRMIQDGVTIVIFPAGGVATAENPWGAAEDLPWKLFASRLVQQAGASVLPVFFEGQNSALFHLVSRYSLSLRLSLLVSEFGRKAGGTVRAHVGPLIPYAELAAIKDRQELTDELYVRVHALDPKRRGASRTELLPRPPHLRRKYPWDEPAAIRRRGVADRW